MPRRGHKRTYGPRRRSQRRRRRHIEDCFKVSIQYVFTISLSFSNCFCVSSCVTPFLLQFLTHQNSHASEDYDQFILGTMSRARSGGDIGVPQPFASQIQNGESNIDVDANNSASISSTASYTRFDKIRNNGFLRRCWAVVSWTPPGCRWDPEHPPKFSMALNLLFAFVSWPYLKRGILI
jgi:hypothetical protein